MCRAGRDRVHAICRGATTILVVNRSMWRRFPKISNERWSVGNCVLVGDALRTAHFSIGSGTRLALEDVQALAHALAEHRRSIPDALARFESERRPVVEKTSTRRT